MRELEFLPSWYHQTRKRKRAVVLETWVLILIVAGLGTWLFMSQQNLQARQVVLNSLQRQVDQKHTEQRILTEQLSLRQELQAKEQLIASLGFPVEMTRLLQTLDSVMPKEMSMIDFDCTTEETPRPVTSVAAVKPGAEKEKLMDRTIKVRMLGVTPSDVDLATLYAGLTAVPFFDQVVVNYARDKIDSGHVFREFELTFSMNVNQPMSN